MSHRIKRAIKLLQDALEVLDSVDGHIDPNWHRCQVDGMSLAAAEKVLIRDTLNVFKWNTANTAKQLGITKSKLRQKVSGYHLAPPEPEPQGDDERETVRAEPRECGKVEHG